MSNDFIKSLKSKVKQDWSKARKVQDEYSTATLPDGNYIAKLTKTRFGKDKNKEPYVSLDFTVLSPEKYKGQRPGRFHGLTARGNRTMDMCLKQLFLDLQRLGIDTSSMEVEDLPAILQQLQDAQPTCRINAKNNPTYGLSIYINSMIPTVEEEEVEEEVEEIFEDEDDYEDDYEDEDEQSEDEDEQSEDEDDEDDEDDAIIDSDDEYEEYEDDDEEEVASPQKGDTCMYRTERRFKPKECTVVTVNNSKETVTLRRINDNKVFKNVSWSNLEA